MECDDIQTRLSEWGDGALDEPRAAAVRDHLEECDLCRLEERRLVDLHEELSGLTASDRARADVIANRVLHDWPTGNATARRGKSDNLRSRRWPTTLIGYLLASVAGFLIAVLWLRPLDSVESLTVDEPITTGSTTQGASVQESIVAPAAHMVHATGNVSYRSPTQEDWTSIPTDSLPTFACPSSGGVRTDAGVLCELETSTGSRVRLNESSEITVLAHDEFELVSGQVWCRASNDVALKVVTTEQSAAVQPPAEHPPVNLFSCVCPSDSESLASRGPTEPMQVVTAAGTIDVRMNGTERTLSPGTFCSVQDGEVKVWHSSSDVLTAERWMQPLLTLSGHGNPELTRRVDALLAQIGRTKLSSLYEQDLRSLGEYAALPLLKFTVAEESTDERAHRQFAMSIIADTAPVWMVPDLIGLLEDDDPIVRRHAAQGLTRLTGETQGLTRLTGETQGLTPDDWQTEPEKLSAGVQLWQQWWQQNRSRCAAPPTSVGERQL